MYPYITPHGYGDTFFIYAMNGEDLSTALFAWTFSPSSHPVTHYPSLYNYYSTE